MPAERDLDRLYGLPRDEFTSARNALVRDLRKAGRKDDAEEVRALKKPSVSAWAVNQLARKHPQEVAELVKAGDALRKAQRDVLAGKKGADVRAESRAQHELADELVATARELLEDSGERASPSVAQRISGTLRAASTDPAAAKALRKGRLTDDVESVGLRAPPARRSTAEGPPFAPEARSHTGTGRGRSEAKAGSRRPGEERGRGREEGGRQGGTRRETSTRAGRSRRETTGLARALS